ncbi:MAG: hypothetical protein O2818_00770 [Bacteroidetes bacterium]|nr:hypothetical protein [Bacteroidota bacterium]MDA1335395.1 hypothetical protein [Bacteroidota bacterium]
MWNSPTPPGRAHYLASLPEQLEIARTSYRFYVAPNVWVFENGKLDYVGTRLVRQAFAEQNRPALLRLFDVHDELRSRLNGHVPAIDRSLLLARFDLGFPPFNEEE